MTGNRLGGLAPSIALLLLSLIYLFTAFGYDTDTRGVPVVVTFITIFLLALDMISQFDNRAGRILRRVFGGATAARPGAEGESAPWGREIAAFAWIIGFTVLAIVFGFYIAIPIYVFAFLRLHARKPLIPIVSIAILLTALLYGAFEMLLGYQIFEGVVFGGYM